MFLQATPTADSLSILDLILKGGIVMIPILFLSVVAFAIIIERLLFIRQRAKIEPYFIQNIIDKLHGGNIESAKSMTAQSNTAIAQIVAAAIPQWGKSLQNVEDVMETAGQIELAEMEKNLGYLGIIAGVAPMLGFIGTISGVIKIFYSISLTDNISIGVISGGLYEKMITSGTGLIVGVVAYMGYHFLQILIDNFSLKLQRNVFELIKAAGK